VWFYIIWSSKNRGVWIYHFSLIMLAPGSNLLEIRILFSHFLKHTVWSRMISQQNNVSKISFNTISRGTTTRIYLYFQPFIIRWIVAVSFDLYYFKTFVVIRIIVCIVW
jgi:hypothetical protein